MSFSQSSLAERDIEPGDGYMDGTKQVKLWPAGTEYVWGYVTDSSNRPVRSGWGFCVRTRSMIHVSKMRTECDEIAEFDQRQRDPGLSFEKRIMRKTVFFDFNRSNLRALGQSKVSQMYQRLLAESGTADRLEITRLSIHGYADLMGSAEYNLKLSDRRSRAVYAAISRQNSQLVDDLRRQRFLDITSFGESRASSLSRECMQIQDRSARIRCLQPERRAEIVVEYQLVNEVDRVTGSYMNFNGADLKIFKKYFNWENDINNIRFSTTTEDIMPTERFRIRNEGSRSLEGLNFSFTNGADVILVESSTCGTSIGVGGECFVNLSVTTLSREKFDTILQIKSYDQVLRTIPVKVQIRSKNSR